RGGPGRAAPRPAPPARFFDIFFRPRIGKENVLDPRTDRTDCQVRPRFLLDLHHCRHVVEKIYGAPDVLKGVEIVRSVFPDELDVIEHPRVADQFDDRGPRTVDMRPQTRLPGIQQFAKTISAHEVSRCGCAFSSSGPQSRLAPSTKGLKFP